MEPLWGGGAHTEAIEGIEMPLFFWVGRKGGRPWGPPGISEASALTVFPGLRFLWGSPDLSGWARSAWTRSSLEPPAVKTWCPLCALSGPCLPPHLRDAAHLGPTCKSAGQCFLQAAELKVFVKNHSLHLRDNTQFPASDVFVSLPFCHLVFRGTSDLNYSIQPLFI